MSEVKVLCLFLSQIDNYALIYINPFMVTKPTSASGPDGVSHYHTAECELGLKNFLHFFYGTCWR